MCEGRAGDKGETGEGLRVVLLCRQCCRDRPVPKTPGTGVVGSDKLAGAGRELH